MRLFLLSLLLCSCCFAQAQSPGDSLFQIDMSKHMYYFDVVDGKCVGEGAIKLSQECSEAQYTCIAEYHNSPAVSRFTEGLIQILDSVGYKHMALEIGPFASDVLKAKLVDSIAIEPQLHQLNTQYGFVESDGYYNSAIPFFNHKEDARFLEELIQRGWDYFGLDQEFYFGFIPLIDHMYAQLSPGARKKFSNDYQTVKDSIFFHLENEVINGPSATVPISQSHLLQKFMTHASKYGNNAQIMNAINWSLEVYNYNVLSRDYIKNNNSRAHNFRHNFLRYTKAHDFDLERDKMAFKMGALHMAKGYNPYEILDMGNFLHELAAMHNNKSVHVYLSPRYYTDEHKLQDRLEEDRTSYKQFIQFGRKDRWTLIDLRAFRLGAFYYPKKYKFDTLTEKMILQYDFLVIPKLEYAASPNWDAKLTPLIGD